MCSKIYNRIRGWLVDTYIVVKLLLFIKLFTFGDRDFRLEKLQFFVQIVFTYIHTTCIHISFKKNGFKSKKKKKKVEIQIVNQSSLLNTLEFVDLSTPEFVE